MPDNRSDTDTPSPLQETATARLRTGEGISIRLLRPDDAERLGDYLCSLSDLTRSYYGPHRFDRPTAEAICASLDPADTWRMVATVGQDADERIIAYVLLKLGVRESDGRRYSQLGITLDPATDASLAPSVADDYQEKGVGTLVMRHLLDVARRMGRRRIVLWDGVQERNPRACHCYQKWGFHKVGEFYNDRNNYDMILDLAENQG